MRRQRTPAPDPMETLIADALGHAGIPFDRDVASPCGTRVLDFWVPSLGIYIEVKRFHTTRAAEQMGTVDDIIVAQGQVAVRALAALILGSTAGRRSLSDAQGRDDSDAPRTDDGRGR